MGMKEGRKSGGILALYSGIVTHGLCTSKRSTCSRPSCSRQRSMDASSPPLRLLALYIHTLEYAKYKHKKQGKKKFKPEYDETLLVLYTIYIYIYIQ